MFQPSPFTPGSIKDRACGPRRSVAPLLRLVDTADPAFPQIAEVLEDMRASGIELTEATVTMALQLGRQRHEREAAHRKAQVRRPAKTGGPIVYYVRRGDLVKIGTTVNPKKRFISLMPDEILAFEPGGTEQEAARHLEFGRYRVARRGEYFTQSEALTEHMANLRRMHGDPPSDWPTTATIGHRDRRTKKKLALAALQGGEAVTTTEGAQRLNISRSTIQGWIYRGVIARVGYNSQGHATYPLEHMKYLKERNKAWRRAPSSGELAS